MWDERISWDEITINSTTINSARLTNKTIVTETFNNIDIGTYRVMHLLYRFGNDKIQLGRSWLK